MKKFLNIDIVAGLLALVYAVLAHTVSPQLGELVSAEAASGFALAALSRGYLALKAAE